MTLNTLGERLAKTLSRMGLNQATAATMTGVAKTTISHLIRNKVKAYKHSSALAEGLNIVGKNELSPDAFVIQECRQYGKAPVVIHGRITNQ